MEHTTGPTRWELSSTTTVIKDTSYMDGPGPFASTAPVAHTGCTHRLCVHVSMYVLLKVSGKYRAERDHRSSLCTSRPRRQGRLWGSTQPSERSGTADGHERGLQSRILLQQRVHLGGHLSAAMSAEWTVVWTGADVQTYVSWQLLVSPSPTVSTDYVLHVAPPVSYER